MAKTTDKGVCTEKFLISVPLPEQTDTYTVISHEDIIQKVENELNNASLEIEDIHYSYSYAGEVALAKVYIKSTVDADMGMLFTWQNSYNKKVKFSCAIGGYIHDNMASLIGTEGLSWIRKHTGNADELAFEVIEGLIDNAKSHFQKVIAEKERMKAMELNEEVYGRVMGALYFEHELVTPNQAMVVKKERKKPTHTYSDIDTLWGLYKLLMYGLENLDITRWQGNQQKLHHMVMAEYAISQEEMQEKLAEALVAPLKADIDLPLSTLPESEDKGEFSWNINEETGEVNEDNIVEDPMPLAPNELRETGPPTQEEMKEVTPEIHIESDIEYQERIVDIEGESDELTKAVEEEVIEVDEDNLVEDPIKLAGEVTGISNDVDEVEVEIEIEEEVISETISNDAEENLATDDLLSKVEQTVEETVEVGDLFGSAEVTEEAVKEEPVVEEIVAEEDEIDFTAIANKYSAEELSEPVPIIAPAKINLPDAKEVTKAGQEALKKVKEVVEEESFLNIKEHDGLTVPDGMIEDAAVIEKKMILLYGSVRPYTSEESGDQINVIIEETYESFCISK
jgi:hypothetical protein